MTDARHPQRTILEVNHTLVAPWEPKTRTVQPRKPADYPHVTKGHLAVAEAEIARHLGGHEPPNHVRGKVAWAVKSARISTVSAHRIVLPSCRGR
ncbi:MAG: hypothetical protein U1E05_02735 [Patescibacteria group bacterium]|nr:hypothetical protein [Patescibacteria group bacterium]